MVKGLDIKLGEGGTYAHYKVEQSCRAFDLNLRQ